MASVRAVRWSVMAVFLIGCAGVRGQAASAPAAGGGEASPEVMRTLELLQARDGTLKDFAAKVRKVDVNKQIDETQARLGTAGYFKDAKVTKLGMHFDRLRLEGQPPKELDEDFLLDGQWFIHRDAASKSFEKKNVGPAPLKLGNCPIPFPIGQDPKAILKDFAVTPQAVDPKEVPKGTEPGDMTAIRLTPRAGDTYRFKQVDLWVDKKLELPTRIAVVNNDDNTTTYTFTEVEVNKGAEPKVLNVTDPGPGSGWNREIVPEK